MQTLYQESPEASFFLWGFRDFEDIQLLNRLRCCPTPKGPITNITQSALRRLHHFFPPVVSKEQLKCFVVQADFICPEPHFCQAQGSAGSMISKIPLPTEYWERNYSSVFCFEQGLWFVRYRKDHPIIAELPNPQFEQLLQRVHEKYGHSDLHQLDEILLADFLAQI